MMIEETMEMRTILKNHSRFLRFNNLKYLRLLSLKYKFNRIEYDLRLFKKNKNKLKDCTVKLKELRR